MKIDVFDGNRREARNRSELIANETLYQLSYTPKLFLAPKIST